eukprot:EC813417.1.p3 GENE.EC813417.1~~EC813417.1.p3  ORF type:complete len:50 (+),score=17.38 EC813417.1:2-151(+)
MRSAQGVCRVEKDKPVCDQGWCGASCNRLCSTHEGGTRVGVVIVDQGDK